MKKKFRAEVDCDKARVENVTGGGGGDENGDSVSAVSGKCRKKKKQPAADVGVEERCSEVAGADDDSCAPGADDRKARKRRRAERVSERREGEEKQQLQEGNGDDDKLPNKKKKKKKEKTEEPECPAMDTGKGTPEVPEKGGNSSDVETVNEGEDATTGKVKGDVDIKKSGRNGKERKGGKEDREPRARPGATAPPEGGIRKCRVGVGIPASIVDNAQSDVLATYLAGQIARAVTVFGVTEVIVYEDVAESVDSDGASEALRFLVRLLRYLETPQYMRKLLFELHADLKNVGLLSPLDAPHHMRASEWLPYREGIVMPPKNPVGPGATSGGSWVNCGLAHNVFVADTIPAGKRVTLKLPPESEEVVRLYQESNRARSRQGLMDRDDHQDAAAAGGVEGGSTHIASREEPKQQVTANAGVKRKTIIKATLASQDDPPELAGIYWGFNTRYVGSLAEVASLRPPGWEPPPSSSSPCPPAATTAAAATGTGTGGSSDSTGGTRYDLIIGTSERGVSVFDPKFNLPKFKNVLLVFGGLSGLEGVIADPQSGFQSSAAADAAVDESSTAPVAAVGEATAPVDPSGLFDAYVNVCPHQRSRTIRTEEALFVALSAMRPLLLSRGCL
eukprot:GHVU01205032.1.p1 GENE.GHVU01205032.1~~GHVU01205032.1.p1  ORF type:complete len:620 (+),score=138.57 GHVU01205032.1:189-2048(+)